MGKRILYIDYLKGLTILWVVWFHTAHPEFVEFSFRIPLFFFVSGIFFRPYPFALFIKKKVNTLIVPFALFYLIYYVFYIMLWILTGRTLSTFDFSTIFSLFELHRGYEGFVINPPLWFIMALINLQFLLYLFVKLKMSKIVLAGISVLISLWGVFIFFKVPTVFMWSRCLEYFVYYSFGYLFGSRIISVIEGERGWRKSILLGCIGLTMFLTCWLLKLYILKNDVIFRCVNYIEIFSLILFMIYFLKYISSLPFLKFLKFYGQNSYVVLGMHEMYLTVLLICYNLIFGKPGIFAGFAMLIVTILLLYPTILFFNRFLPHLVGKRELWRY